MKPTRKPALEQLETKLLPTLVFVFNGNGYAEAKPNQITQNAADILNAHGDRRFNSPRQRRTARRRSIRSRMRFEPSARAGRSG